jgi:hypothetical protein
LTQGKLTIEVFLTVLPRDEQKRLFRRELVCVQDELIEQYCTHIIGWRHVVTLDTTAALLGGSLESAAVAGNAAGAAAGFATHASTTDADITSGAACAGGATFTSGTTFAGGAAFTSGATFAGRTTFASRASSSSCAGAGGGVVITSASDVTSAA